MDEIQKVKDKTFSILNEEIETIEKNTKYCYAGGTYTKEMFDHTGSVRIQVDFLKKIGMITADEEKGLREKIEIALGRDGLEF